MATLSHAITPSAEDTHIGRQRVLDELHSITSSHHFRNSKRYPALLTYVVVKTLDGESEYIKERTLGIEVFNRKPDYDTNADPVVRFSAGAIRRKIAQYYQETGNVSDLQIDLPIGSYVPEFRVRMMEGKETDHHLEESLQIGGAPPLGIPTRSLLPWRYSWAAAALILLACLGMPHVWTMFRVTPLDRIWAPLLQPGASVLVVMGASHPELGNEPRQTTVYQHMLGPYNHVTLSSATSMARLCGVLNAHGKEYEIREDPFPTLTDLRARPVVLIGAMNNIWTMRLNQQLRYRFSNGPVARIVDTKAPSRSDWQLDFLSRSARSQATTPSSLAIMTRQRMDR